MVLSIVTECSAIGLLLFVKSRKSDTQADVQQLQERKETPQRRFRIKTSACCAAGTSTVHDVSSFISYFGNTVPDALPERSHVPPCSSE
jgi:hypothetical protein